MQTGVSIPLQEACPETQLTPNGPNPDADKVNRSHGQSPSGSCPPARPTRVGD